MKKSEKKALNRRLMLIYVGYFLLLAIGFVSSTMPLMSVGFKSGNNLAEMEMEEYRECYFVAVRPTLMNDHLLSNPLVEDKMEISLSPYEAFATIKADRTTTPHVVIQGLNRNAKLIFIINFAILICWFGVFVLIALIINSMRRSIRDEHPLPSRNILYMRLVGGFILLNVFCEWLTLHLGHQMVALAHGSMPEAFRQVIPDYITAVLALLVIFSAEIFSVGSKLSEEQKLTI